MGKELRYYQIEAKDAVLRALRRGVKKLLLLMPGGTGKTRTAVNIISEMGRKLWIVHEESLGEQGAIALLDELDLMPFNDLITTINSEGGLIQLIENSKKQVFLSENVKLIAKNVGIIKADLFDINKPIVIASAQTLHARLSKIPKDWFKVIVADECDLFFSRTFKMPLEYFEYELLLGLTATNFRADGVEMTDIFDETVYEYTLEQAIKDKYLTELNAIVVRTTTNLDDLGMMAGDFKIKELTEKVNTPQRNNLIVKKYFEYCEGQQFICFGADVDHVIELHETFEREGVKTAYVVSDKTKMVIGTDRKQIVQAITSGNADVGAAQAKWSDMLTKVSTRQLTGKQAKIFAKQLVNEGWEGCMCVDGNSKYQIGKRVNYSVKLKYRKTADLLCIDTIPGDGKYVGEIGSLVLQDSEGRIVAVGSGLDDIDRVKNPNHFIGKIIEIEYEQIMDTYIQPVFNCVRYDKVKGD